MSLPHARPLDAAAPRAHSRYAPRIIAIAFLGHLFAVGSALSIYGVFIEEVAAAFGIGMAAAALGVPIYQAVNAGTAPFVGRLLARVPIRRVMLTGAVLLCAGLVGVSRAGTVAQAAIAYGGLVGLGAVLMGALPSSTLIANWFAARRGRALGMAAAGTTAASVVFPPLAAWLIAQHGWRQALLMIGIGVGVLVIPLIATLVISRPEDVGERPDGGLAPPPDPSAPPVAETAITTAEIMRDRNFWVMGVAFGLVFGAGSVVMLFLVPLARELGLSLELGALLLSMRSGMGVIGKVVLGSLSDRWGQRPVIWASMGLQLVMWTALVTFPSVRLLIVTSVVLGFTGGALYPLRNALIGELFPRRAFAPVIGLLSLVQFPLAVLLVPLAGYLRDLTGSYVVSFSAFIPAYAIAPLLLLLLRMPGAGSEPEGRP